MQIMHNVRIVVIKCITKVFEATETVTKGCSIVSCHKNTYTKSMGSE